MNIKLFLAIWVPVVILSPCYGDDTSTTIVQGEYAKVQSELSISMTQAKKNLRDLANDKKRAILDSQSQAKIERQGIDALKKYDLLLTIRYADEKGQYQSAVEVSQKDIENLNKLFDVYLHAMPLVGRSSVGYARKMIDWGIRRIEDLSKIHADPTESNNPDLEIIAQQTKDADQRIKTVNELASRLGVKLNENIALNTEREEQPAPVVVAPPPTASRRPASQSRRSGETSVMP